MPKAKATLATSAVHLLHELSPPFCLLDSCHHDKCLSFERVRIRRGRIRCQVLSPRKGTSRPHLLTQAALPWYKLPHCPDSHADPISGRSSLELLLIATHLGVPGGATAESLLSSLTATQPPRDPRAPLGAGWAGVSTCAIGLSRATSIPPPTTRETGRVVRWFRGSAGSGHATDLPSYALVPIVADGTQAHHPR